MAALALGGAWRAGGVGRPIVVVVWMHAAKAILGVRFEVGLSCWQKQGLGRVTDDTDTDTDTDTVSGHCGVAGGWVFEASLGYK